MDKEERRIFNRDIRRLYRDYLEWDQTNPGVNPTKKRILKHQFQKLYDLDPTFALINRDNILKMIRMNLNLKEIPLERFGNQILI